MHHDCFIEIAEDYRVSLVPIRPTHLAICCRWFADPEVYRYLAIPRSPTLEQEIAWLRSAHADPSRIDWAILVALTAHVGVISIHNIDWQEMTGTIGIIIGKRSHWGKGIGWQAVAGLVQYCRQELHLKRVSAEIATCHNRSIRLFTSLGFTAGSSYRVTSDIIGSGGQVISVTRECQLYTLELAE